MVMNEIISWLSKNSTFLIIFFTGINFFLMIFDRFINKKPRIQVRFPDLSSRVTYHHNEDRTITFHFKNKGDLFRLKKPSANLITAFMYFPCNFEIKEVRRAGYKTNEIFKTPISGRFKNMQYVLVPSVYKYNPPAITVLYYEETEICEVDVRTPKETGIYDIFIPISSREGELGVEKVKINII